MRTFIAITLGEPIKRRLAEARQLFAALDGKVGWTRSEQMHLTVKFLGSVNDGSLDRIIEIIETAADAVSPFELDIRGLGCFPKSGRRLRVLYADLASIPPELATVRKALDSAFIELGVNREDRDFTPHLTLGRVKSVRRADDYRRVIEANADFVVGRQQVTALTLYRSDLKPTGAEYKVLKCVDLR